MLERFRIKLNHGYGAVAAGVILANLIFPGILSPVSGNALKPLEKENRHLPSFTCSRLQHRTQREIMLHEWGMEKLKFQQRLKKHPQYIVTVEHVRSLHEPLIELRCPGISVSQMQRNSLEFHFFEARFQAEVVRLFDIKSIFPLHSGSMNVKMKLDPLVVLLNQGTDLSVSIRDMYFSAELGNSTSSGETLTNKEHREDPSDPQSAVEQGLLELEKEIESVFVNRIRPEVQTQLKTIIKSIIKRFFEQETLFRF